MDSVFEVESGRNWYLWSTKPRFAGADSVGAFMRLWQNPGVLGILSSQSTENVDALICDFIGEMDGQRRSAAETDDVDDLVTKGPILL